MAEKSVSKLLVPTFATFPAHGSSKETCFFYIRFEGATFGSEMIVILLMEEILHRLGCIKPCK